MPSDGNKPSDLDNTELCYTHTTPITAPEETYAATCDTAGSVVSLMLPGENKALVICEVQVFGESSGDFLDGRCEVY